MADGTNPYGSMGGAPAAPDVASIEELFSKYPMNLPGGPQQPPAEPRAFGSITRGYHSLVSGLSLAGYMTGALDQNSAIQGVMEAQAGKLSAPPSPTVLNAYQEYQNLGNNPLEIGWFFGRNPSFLASAAGESAAASGFMALTGLAGAGAGTLAGVPWLGLPVGVGLGSALSEYGNSFETYLQEKSGSPLWDEIGLYSALNNPALVQEAHEFAATRAGLIGAFDAAGIKLAGPITKLLGRGATTITGRLPEALSVQAAFGAGGEAAAQAATVGPGNINLRDVALEGVLEYATGAPAQIASRIYNGLGGMKEAPPPPPLALPPPAAIVTPPPLGSFPGDPRIPIPGEFAPLPPESVPDVQAERVRTVQPTPGVATAPLEVGLTLEETRPTVETLGDILNNLRSGPTGGVAPQAGPAPRSIRDVVERLAPTITPAPDEQQAIVEESVSLDPVGALLRRAQRGDRTSGDHQSEILRHAAELHRLYREGFIPSDVDRNDIVDILDMVIDAGKMAARRRAHFITQQFRQIVDRKRAGGPRGPTGPIPPVPPPSIPPASPVPPTGAPPAPPILPGAPVGPVQVPPAASVPPGAPVPPAPSIPPERPRGEIPPLPLVPPAPAVPPYRGEIAELLASVQRGAKGTARPVEMREATETDAAIEQALQKLVDEREALVGKEPRPDLPPASPPDANGVPDLRSLEERQRALKEEIQRQLANLKNKNPPRVEVPPEVVGGEEILPSSAAPEMAPIFRSLQTAIRNGLASTTPKKWGEVIMDAVESASDIVNLRPVFDFLASGKSRISKYDLLAVMEDMGVRATQGEEADVTTAKEGGLSNVVTLRFEPALELASVANTENLGTVQYSDRMDLDGVRTLVVESSSIANIARYFSTGPTALVVQRLLRWARDNGYKKIAVVPKPENAVVSGELHFAARRNGYQRAVASFTALPRDGGASQTWEARSAIWIGEPITVPTQFVPDEDIKVTFRPFEWAKIGISRAQAQKVVDAGMAIMRKFGIKYPIDIIIHSLPVGSEDTGMAVRLKNDRYRIEAAVGPQTTPISFYTILMHEFGHILTYDVIEKLTVGEYNILTADLDRIAEGLSSEDAISTALARTMSVGRAEILLRPGEGRKVTKFGDLTESEKASYYSRMEMMAEQVARWATTSRVPLTIAEKIYKTIAKRLTELFKAMQARFGLGREVWNPTPTFNAWLDSFGKQMPSELEQTTRNQNGRGQQDNARSWAAAGSPEVHATPQDVTTAFARRGLGRLFRDNLEALGPIRVAAAGADRLSWLAKWTYGIQHLAKANPHIPQLARYKETIQLANLYRTQIMDRWLTTLKMWNDLSTEKAEKLASLIDDYMNMVYRTPEEVRAKRIRKPTEDELQGLYNKHRIDNETDAVFTKIADDFKFWINENRTAALEDAQRISNPNLRLAAVEKIEQAFAKYNDVPYFPMTRFGDLTLTLYEFQPHPGQEQRPTVIRFETFDDNPIGKRDRARKAKEWEAAKEGTQYVQIGKLAPDVQPFVGMPTTLLKSMGEKLNLSTTQRDALEQLLYLQRPTNAFEHRFQHRKRIPGYSKDFQRAFAKYGFHGSSFLMRVKYDAILNQQISELRHSEQFMPDSTTRTRIREFVGDHFGAWKDPKPDWANFRAFAFHWMLGFNAPAALLNLSQLVVATYPYLASRFGDLRTMQTMGNVSKDFSTFYKQGTLKAIPAEENGELWAIGEGIRDGIITEAMAPELAGLAEGQNLLKRFGGGRAVEAWARFSEASAIMFQLMEQANRRVTFRAAYRLARNNPNNEAVRQAIRDNSTIYATLTGPGVGRLPVEAAAYVFAKDAVEATQYLYTKDFQPRLFRGPVRRTMFMFKTFVLNTLFFVGGETKRGNLRPLLIMAFLGGLMGLPGAEDLEDALKVFAWQLFGKDFDLEKEARQFVLDLFGDAISPDVLLHGSSRFGYGIPAMVDLISGGIANVDVPIPVIDRSKSVGMGQISPLPLAPLFGPQKNMDKAIAKSIENVAGAPAGLAFSMFQGIRDMFLDPGDPKRWERIMPRALANVSKGWMAFQDQEVRARDGTPIVRFDPTEPEHIAERIAMMIGYTPLRLSREWDRIMMTREQQMYWDVRRGIILEQFRIAMRGRDQDEIKEMKSVVREFNRSLPQEAKGKVITSEGLRKSLESQARIYALRERGVEERQNVGIARSVRRLFPGSQPPSEIRKVE